MPAEIDTYAAAAGGLESLINAVFAPESIVVVHDELHESLGWDGIYVGVAPIRELPQTTNRLAKHTLLHVQFFDIWDKDIDPAQTVDPRRITGFHTRFLAGLREATITVNGGLWFYSWEGTEYPRDPTGNKTRFVADIRCYSNNSALVETTS